MTTLVTGASGFVGRHLMRLLESRSLDPIGISLGVDPAIDQNCVSLDLMQPERLGSFIKELRPSAVYHLAGQSSVALSWKNPKSAVQLNVIGTLNLLNALRDHASGCRALLVSTGEVYGKGHPARLFREKDAPDPQNPYAMTKLLMEQLSRPFIRQGLEILLARPLSHIGPGQGRWFMLGDFIAQIVDIGQGRQEHAIRVGNLKVRRDFTDVRDVVRAYELLMEKGRPGEIYNIASGRIQSVREVLEELIKLAGIELQVKVDPERVRPADEDGPFLDTRKLKKATGWAPEIALPESLADSLEYWRRTL